VALTVGVDIGGTKVRAATVDARGEITRRVVRPTDREAGIGSVVAALEELLGGEGNHEAAGIGIGAAGHVERASGRVVFAPNVTYERPEIAEVVAARFGLPVDVENDANAAAWAEYCFGAGQGASHLLMVTVGTGIGGGVVIGGELYRGARGFAAEFGHMTLMDGGPQCTCGERGCLEALASGTAIARMAREGVGGAPDSILPELSGEIPSRITGALVSEAAHAGDEFAIEVLERAGRWLGVGFANLVNAFDPEIIVVGGGAAEAGYPLLETARMELDKRVGPRRATPGIITARLGNDAGVIGASALVRSAAGID
jgi:glucokinase